MFVNAFRFLGAVSVGALLSISPAAAATYVYTGLNFTSATGSYTTSDSVTGSLTVASPLGDSMTYVYSTMPTPFSWSFSDGVQMISGNDTSNSNVATWLVTTGTTGNIVSWLIDVVIGTASNPPFIEIFSGGGDTACNSSPCSASGDASNDTAGSWAPQTSATPLPAALPLFAGGLGMMGWIGSRRRHKRQTA
jgi:hypothetical protein